ncbi:MAG TPA: MarR family winged helix-turn-helix transcriptional regulator [Stellaceae bacterium]|nr:MarR family winged helix-turn-helix transcriptional regulator [Stellaceae bacterium]
MSEPNDLPHDLYDLQTLHERPGFMIRRAHQIAQSLFLEQTGGITPTQYGVMCILEARPDLDQIGVAKLLGQDRSTAALVIGKLTDDGLVERRDAIYDRRCKTLSLTPRGHAVLAQIGEPVRRSHDKLLSVFEPEEAAQFLTLLHKFVSAFNTVSRTPLDIEPSKRNGRRAKS